MLTKINGYLSPLISGRSGALPLTPTRMFHANLACIQIVAMLSPMGLCVVHRNEILCLSPQEISFEGWGYTKIIQGGKEDIKLA